MTANVIFCALCYLGSFACMCRLNLMSQETTKTVILARYVVWGSVLALAGLMGLAGLFTAAACALLAAFLVDLAISLPDWRFGQPKHAQK